MSGHGFGEPDLHLSPSPQPSPARVEGEKSLASKPAGHEVMKVDHAHDLFLTIQDRQD